MIQIKSLRSKISEGRQDHRDAEQNNSGFVIFSAEEPLPDKDRCNPVHAALFLS